MFTVIWHLHHRGCKWDTCWNSTIKEISECYIWQYMSCLSGTEIEINPSRLEPTIFSIAVHYCTTAPYFLTWTCNQISIMAGDFSAVKMFISEKSASRSTKVILLTVNEQLLNSRIGMFTAKSKCTQFLRPLFYENTVFFKFCDFLWRDNGSFWTEKTQFSAVCYIFFTKKDYSTVGR